MGIDNLSFLQATNPYIQTQQPRNYGYNNTYQGIQSQGVPTTNPTVVGIPSTEDMELAQRVAGSNIFAQAIKSPEQKEEMYKPTGTGELSPELEGRDDEIADCPWNEYYA